MSDVAKILETLERTLKRQREALEDTERRIASLRSLLALGKPKG